MLHTVGHMERSNKTESDRSTAGSKAPDHRPPRRAPTMDDVAERAGVSRALVSLVIREAPNVSAARRKAVREAAEALGYRPNAAARSLAERRSKTVGVVVNDLHNPFFADVVDGIHEAGLEQGYRLVLNTAWRADADELAAVEAFLEYQVDVVIVLGPRAQSQHLREAAATAPLVAVGSNPVGIDSVINDDEQGSALVVDYLAGLGHSRIVHIDGGSGGGADRRRQGYVSAMERAGLEPWVVAGDYTEASGSAVVQQLLADRRPPTAIYAANDLSAVGVLGQLADAEVEVPDDISLVGYDNTFVSALRHIDLTTVDQPKVDMGRRALELGLNRLETGRDSVEVIVLQPELVVRTSSGPPRS